VHTVLVKICGITRLEDAEAAVECGAGAVGFVFWPDSPRFVDPYRARTIAAALPPFITTVGVFVNQPSSYVNGVASLAHLSAVQLHGDEDMAFAATMTRPVIKAVTKMDDRANGWPARIMLLIDAHDPVARGGTGAVGDWSAAAALAASRRVLLAGGLTAENVAEALARVLPFGIDVSSGVEASPGIKDHKKMSAFFRALPS
jgi:phosphoribosylanthranilate isomerase